MSIFSIIFSLAWLDKWFSQCGPQTSSDTTVWELVKNAGRDPSQTHWNRNVGWCSTICVLTIPLGHCDVQSGLRILVWGNILFLAASLSLSLWPVINFWTWANHLLLCLHIMSHPTTHYTDGFTPPAFFLDCKLLGARGYIWFTSLISVPSQRPRPALIYKDKMLR